jgi:RNA polymerase sigma-70 factor (ECF subfamily)
MSRVGPARRVYCVIPRELADELHEALRQHFADDPRIEVVVELRISERRASDRRQQKHGPVLERRQADRRLNDRRGFYSAVRGPGLPERLRNHARRLSFVQALDSPEGGKEDADSARLVARVQSGDREAFAVIYMRYFDRVYSYLRSMVGDAHEAEDLTQRVFLSALEDLPRYRQRGHSSFRAWLFRIARNDALDHLAKHGRVEVQAPQALNRLRHELAVDDGQSARDPRRIEDADLVSAINRLPGSQRDALMLRYVLDFTGAETAGILERSAADVRVLCHRGLKAMRASLAAQPRKTNETARSADRRDQLAMERLIAPSASLQRRQLALIITL